MNRLKQMLLALLCMGGGISPILSAEQPSAERLAQEESNNVIILFQDSDTKKEVDRLPLTRQEFNMLKNASQVIGDMVQDLGQSQVTEIPLNNKYIDKAMLRQALDILRAYEGLKSLSLPGYQGVVAASKDKNVLQRNIEKLILQINALGQGFIIAVDYLGIELPLIKTAMINKMVAKNNLLYDFPKILTGHTDAVYSIACSPDGKYIASGSWDKTVRVWNVDLGTLAYTLTGHNQPVYSVAWSPDGNFIASGSSDKTIRVWDVQTQQIAYTLTDRTNTVYSVAWSPDGNSIAGGSHDATVRVWDVQTQSLAYTLTGHTGVAWSVAWSPDGNYIASGSFGEKIRVWDVQRRTLAYTLNRPH